jgi:adenylate kinase family enzyme
LFFAEHSEPRANGLSREALAAKLANRTVTMRAPMNPSFPEPRIIVIGNTCAGKTTLGMELAERLSLPFIDLDALFWQPNWRPLELSEFRKRVLEATDRPGWVLVGNYTTQQQDISWARANGIVYLDVALPIVVSRILLRSYRRWQKKELLWGTNYERFFEQLKVWDEHSSLIAWAVRHHTEKQRAYADAVRDARWKHIEFRRFGSNRAAEAWLATLPNR